nr:hypothetical protein [Tanacetum cinerariifolium]
RLLVRVVLNVEVGVAALPTLPRVTTSISTTPEREDRGHTDSVAEPNLCTIGAPRRFIIFSDSSHHSGTNVAEAEVDSLISSSAPIMMIVTTITPTVVPTFVTKEKVVEPALFGTGFSSVGRTNPITCVFSDLTDDGRICREMADGFALSKFFVYIRRMDHDHLFTEFNVGAARQMSLSAEIGMRAEYNIKKKRRLKCVVDKQGELQRLGKKKLRILRSLLDEANALKERNAILEKERDALDVKVHELEVSSFGLQEKVTVYENCMEQLEKFQDDRMKIINDKFDKLYTDFVEMALHLKEKFYPHLLTIIFGRMRLLTHGMELAIVKCLNSPEYLSALETTIGKAIEKGMQDGLATGITHGKDDGVEQPNVGQLMVPIHYSPDQVVVGATALSLALDTLSFRVRKIRVNIENQRSVLCDVFVLLAEPFSSAVLMGAEVNPDTVLATATTTALSTTLASTSAFDHIFIDDYEVVDADDQAVAGENVASFSNVDDAELHIPQIPLITANRGDLRLTALAFFASAGRVSSVRYLKIGVIQVNSIPSGFVSISPASEPSVQDDPSVNKIYGSGSSSSTSIRVSRDPSSGRSTMKYSSIFPLTDTLGL